MPLIVMTTATSYYPDYVPKNASKFSELEKVFGECEKVEALKFRVMLYTLDRSYDREDIMVALKRVERARGWKVD